MRTALLASLLVLGATAPVLAHIHLTYPAARTDSMTGDQKEQHCGVANQVRNPARTTVLAPGATITVTWLETIQHPGWFRIAFQPDGAVFGIPPSSGGNGFPNINQEGLDATNSSIVLKDRIPDGQLSLSVTLPNMECANCTLQFIQVMTDKAPYTVDANSDDIYFNCADITLSNTPAAPDAGPGGGGTPDAPGGGGGGGGGGDSVDGGCSTTDGTGLIGTALFAGLLALRRRRR